MNGWLTYRRQRKDKADESADALRQRREEFELQHLVETNQKLHAYLERFHDFTSAARKARMAEQQNRPHLDGALTTAHDALDEAEGALHGNVGFILDDEIRSKVRQAMTYIDLAAADALTGDSVPYGEVGRVINEAFGALSQRVRAIYADQPAA
ncbi:hypothetical protein [Streptomyces sp. NPDC001978]|uniref:hypothetical protein n=1 Tax=Streptomyces sp. NPDC001978 TaxID=3364627 RepID=UPI0036C94C95